MDDKQYTIRPMTRPELDLAVEWAAAEGWNPGWYDADCYWAADPTGFLVGLLGEEPVASISVVKYGDSFGFLGFYIVKPLFRGQGYGMQLWKAGLNYLKGRNVGLDGVVTQQENYKKSGFKLAHRNIRFEGIGGGATTGDAALVPLDTVPFELLRAYNQPFFPVARADFLKCWLQQPGSYALGVKQQDNLAGYGVIRPCRTGYKIGPLFADSNEVADLLFTELTAQVNPADPVFLDVPAVNQKAVDLAERYKMTPSFETARMYTHELPDLNLTNTFGITSFEVG